MIFEIRHVLNPDYNGYKEEHLCFIEAKSKSKAYKKVGIKACGYYPIREVPKKEAKKLKSNLKKRKTVIKQNLTLKKEEFNLIKQHSSLKRMGKLLKAKKLEIAKLKKARKKLRL